MPLPSVGQAKGGARDIVFLTFARRVSHSCGYRVLMSGDSAGGNLVAAMHVYMLQNNLSEFMADHLLFVSVLPA